MPTATAINTIENSCRVTQDQLRAALREAQIALVDERDALAQIDPRVYEALLQFLRVARQMQVEQMPLAEVQAKMAKTLDETWAHQRASYLRPGRLPEMLKVVQALATSPILTVIAKQLVSQGV